MGNSLYEPPTQQGSSSSDGQMQTLPYCEGLEVGPKQLLVQQLVNSVHSALSSKIPSVGNSHKQMLGLFITILYASAEELMSAEARPRSCSQPGNKSSHTHVMLHSPLFSIYAASHMLKTCQ